MRTLLLSLALMVACDTDPGKDKVSATVQDVPGAGAEDAVSAATAAPGATTPSARPTPLAVDLAKSKLSCIGAKITEQHPIIFHKYTGKITVCWRPDRRHRIHRRYDRYRSRPPQAH